MSQTPDPGHVTVHYFVDEAGTPTLFGKRRQVIVGQEGCSNYFFLGKVDVDEPSRVRTGLGGTPENFTGRPILQELPVDTA